MKTTLALAALAALSLAACDRATGTSPEGSAVGAAMPDTSTPRAPNATLTAPDAGQTGAVPADGSAPAVAPTPDVGSAGGSPGVPGAAVTPEPK
ncbi:hypothetical protein [Phenylobacterium sp.]|uniref:hypothetical protein n=1 Tax=Phenylobacterium sp. TaxID=1871053 RepID=UPI0039833B49